MCEVRRVRTRGQHDKAKIYTHLGKARASLCAAKRGAGRVQYSPTTHIAGVAALQVLSISLTTQGPERTGRYDTTARLHNQEGSACVNNSCLHACACGDRRMQNFDAIAN
eukprot:6200077-Pleurochrysis_carterae.AAC.2